MRILGVDYGERRVGFAVSDPMGTIAFPLHVAEVKSDRDSVEAVRDAVAEFQIEQVVVGLPLNMDGTRGPMVEKVDAFITSLENALDCPVSTWDERLSTGLVERTLLEADISRRKRKQVRDKLAAQVILQGYLDAHQD